MKKGIAIILLLFTAQLYGQTPVIQWPFDAQTGDQATVESISHTIFNISNKFNNPEFYPGVSGKALRLDGYSTYATGAWDMSTHISNKMSITLWYATEAFAASTDEQRQLVKNAAIISQQDDQSGFAIETGPYGELFFVLTADGTKISIVTPDLLQKYKWNYIVVTVDLAVGEVKIYVNGDLQKNENIGVKNSYNWSSTPLFLGKNSYDDDAYGFSVTHANGLLDDVKVYDEILTLSQIETTYSTHQDAAPDLNVYTAIRHADDYLRPQYHAMPNTLWANESYGLTYYNNKYHLFFQKNPNAPVLHFMHWGHLSSADMVNWIEEPMPFGPDKSPGFDDFGTWSGTTIKDANGKPVIFYTGVNTARASIGMATANDEDLISWTKSADNPVIPNSPSGLLDFRDPFLWQEGSDYYMIVGSGYGSNTGGYLATYKSIDLSNWTKINTLYSRQGTSEEYGIFWEMPFFQKLNDQNEYLLGVTPVYNNGKRADVLYWIGKWENEQFEPYFDEPKFMDFTEKNMLAPSVGVDENERLSYIGIIPETRSVESQNAAGWKHTFSLPRVMRLLEDSTLGQYPHPNLCRFRSDEKVVSDRTVNKDSGGGNLPEFSGNQVQYEFEIDADQGAEFSLQFLKSDDGSQFTKINFSLQDNQITMDTRNASDAAYSVQGGVRFLTKQYVFDYKESIHVSAFIDHSVIEVFVDNLLVISSRVYPTESSKNTDLVVSSGSIQLVKAQQWEMRGFGQDAIPEVCEPSYLPNAFRKTESLSTPLSIKKKNKWSNYPNPVTDYIEIKGEGINQLIIYSLDGRKILHHTVDTRKVDVRSLTPGVYMLHLQGINKNETKKIIIK